MLRGAHARAGGRRASVVDPAEGPEPGRRELVKGGESVKFFTRFTDIRCPSIVEVEWLDSSRGENWELVERCDFKAHSCRSVGWLIYEDKDSIVVASHAVIERGKIAQVFGDMT